VGSVPVLKPREAVALLQTLGFVEVRQRGSHKQFRHSDGRCTTVPFHGARDISPTLLRKMRGTFVLLSKSCLRHDSGTTQPAVAAAGRDGRCAPSRARR
jgi:predicted RNA binding protein YcfA (HicA-like mRNA interferase family)